MSGILEFDLPQGKSSVIKVVGVGGGGSNAVNHMYRIGAKGVDFAVCNTDEQALNNSPVPNKIQLGVTTTKGLGAGANPEVGEKSAKENLEEIRAFLGEKTEMLFITAGMGGGTGTGAAPIIARTARELNVLTVGIVTIPFRFEGPTRMRQAQEGITKMKEFVDTLIVVNNDKIREIYGNLGFKSAFAKADEILANATKGISEVITQECQVNIDLNDARTVLEQSGTAIMGTGEASGENRAEEALKKAVHSPLLNNNHILGAKNVLLLIMSGQEEVTFDEVGYINDLLIEEAGGEGKVDIIMGVGEDETIGNNIAVTVIATGFEEKNDIGKQPTIKREVIKHKLDFDENTDPFEESMEAGEQNTSVKPTPQTETTQETKAAAEKLVEEIVEEAKEAIQPIIEAKETPSSVVTLEKEEKIEEKNTGNGIFQESSDLTSAELIERARKRRERLQKYNYNNLDQANMEQVENIPAYKRQGIKLDNHDASAENVERYNLEDDSKDS
ncbi:MAG: cell division protein FtsZ [Flavobacteriales bacterium]|jgi:cell division protein FtsZ|nr:cell division protein FtsZ [Flavobacteriales bacterium]